MSEMIQKAFDYDGHPDPPPPHLREPVQREEVDTRWDESLSPETQEFVQKITDEIHGQLKRTAEGVIKIGLNLIEVKGRLPRGQFVRWLKTEFEMSQPMASRFMQSASRFKDKVFILNNLSPTILYELASASTSDEMIERVQSGEVEASLSAIRAEKLAEKRRADEEMRSQGRDVAPIPTDAGGGGNAATPTRGDSTGCSEDGGEPGDRG